MPTHHGGKIDIRAGVLTLKEFFEGARDAGYAQQIMRGNQEYTLTESKQPVAVVRKMDDAENYSDYQVLFASKASLKIIRDIMEKSRDPVLLTLGKAAASKPFAVLEPLEVK